MSLHQAMLGWNRVVLDLLALACIHVGFVDAANAQERMYTVKWPGLWQLDPATGAEIDWTWGNNSQIALGSVPLASWNGRLVGIGGFYGTIQSRVVSVHLPDVGLTASTSAVANTVHKSNRTPFLECCTTSSTSSSTRWTRRPVT